MSRLPLSVVPHIFQSPDLWRAFGTQIGRLAHTSSTSAGAMPCPRQLPLVALVPLQRLGMGWNWRHRQVPIGGGGSV